MVLQLERVVEIRSILLADAVLSMVNPDRKPADRRCRPRFRNLLKRGLRRKSSHVWVVRNECSLTTVLYHEWGKTGTFVREISDLLYKVGGKIALE